MHAFRILAVAALVAAPLVAQAADLPARYTVEEKPLKAALAGTNLTFNLYSDPLCTTLVSTATIAIENVDLIGRIKPFNPKNAVKKKNTAELRATLTSVPPTPSLYLTVTGTGIAPIGGVCQVQASGLSGPPGSGQLLVKDSNGNTIGPFDGSAGAMYDDGGTLVRFTGLTMAGFQQVFFHIVYYTSVDCTGTGLAPVDNSLATFVQVVGTTGYYFPSTGTSTNTNSQLLRSGTVNYTSQAVCDGQFGPGNTTFVAPDGCCDVIALTQDLGPVQTIDLSGFVPPFSLQ
jgi:hypothetical protein